MSQLFNFQTLSVSLSKELRNCKVSILNSCPQFCNQKFIDELEQLFDWLSNKTEIASVLIETECKDFSLLSKKTLRYSNEQVFSKYLAKIQRLSWGQTILPQTIIWNFKETCDFLAIELSSGSDLVTCHPSFTTSFDILKKGISPSCGATGLLAKKIGINKLKSFVMINKLASAVELNELGVISFINYADELSKMLKEIAAQSPIARIQFKRAINDCFIAEMDNIMTSELSFAKASLVIGDWSRWANEKEFANPREYGKTLRSVPTQHDYKQPIAN